jgi:hypothetical protein
VPVTRQQVVPISVDYTCDSCGVGVMRSTGTVLMTYPAKHTHVCANCSTERIFDCVYPYISYTNPSQLTVPKS